MDLQIMDQGPRDMTVVGSIEAERAIAEVKGAIVMARMAPRNEIAAMDRIKRACMRPRLAEAAVYAFPRGDTTVTGPSIRLAEALAQSWGNIQTGIRELAQGDGESTVEAFAWDLETNYRSSKVFTVKHERHAKRGVTILTDPRDIYEKVANDGSRRLRACILAVIPADVCEDAVKQCEETLKNSTPVNAEQIKKMVDAFAGHGIKADQLEARLGHRLTEEATISAELLSLRRIYNSIRDGMGRPEDYFGAAVAQAHAQPATVEELRKSLEAFAKDPAMPKPGADAIAKALADKATPESVLRDLYEQAATAVDRVKAAKK